MIPDKSPVFSTTYTEQTPPSSVEQNGNRVVLNFSPSVPQIVYIWCHADTIRKSLVDNARFICIRPSPQAQQDFVLAVRSTSKKTFSDNECNLKTVAQDLQAKTSAFVLKRLELEKSKDAATEKTDSDAAKNFPSEIGTMFTRRQAEHLVWYIDELKKQRK